MKNLTPVLIAFFMGMVLCFTIQACADDKQERTPSGSGTTTSSDTYGWDTEKFNSEEVYDSNGEFSHKIENTYDDKGRLVERKYSELGSDGKLYVSLETYTYEGNKRIKITEENRKIIQTLYTE